MSAFSDYETARRLILTYGWNTTSYQIINPGIKHWFSTKGDALVGFVSSAGVRVAVGAPVCAKERLPEVAEEFERDAAQTNEIVCYVCAEARLEAVCRDSPKHSQVLLGAQPAWQPSNWGEIINENKSLRAQLNRARNKSVSVTEWQTERAHNNSALENCLHEWLAEKGLPPLHFMVEPETLSRLDDRRIFTAERSGEVVGFVVLSPVATRKGWLFEQFIHCPNAPNGTVELMIATAMHKLAADNYEYATLGLSPLSKRAKLAPFDNPLWVKILLAWMRKHGQRFYNFDGLDAFKNKLEPDGWEAVFAITNEPKISFRVLYAIASAFSNNAPFRLIGGGLAKALAIEIRRLKNGLK